MSLNASEEADRVVSFGQASRLMECQPPPGGGEVAPILPPIEMLWEPTTLEAEFLGIIIR